MKKNMVALITAVVLFATVNQLSAQTTITGTPTSNRVFLRVGIEPTTMITFGYQRNFRLGFLEREIGTYAEWGASLFRFSLKNSELKIGGILPVLEKRSFKIVNNLNFSLGGNSTHNFDSKKFSLADEVAVGFYKKVWFIAATIEYEKILMNHIEHTDFYRKTYYEDAKDGWYKGGGGMFKFGWEGGVTIKEKYDIHLEMKFPVTERFNLLEGMPFHMNAGLGYRF